MEETYFDCIPEELLIVISSYLYILKDFSNLYVASNRWSILFDREYYRKTLFNDNIDVIYLNIFNQINSIDDIKIGIKTPTKDMKIMKDFDAISNRYVKCLHAQNHTNSAIKLIQRKIKNMLLLSETKQNCVCYKQLKTIYDY